MSKVTNDQNIKEWTEKSAYVIEKFTEKGDFYRQHVLNPALLSLLGTVKGKTILDAGSGEGYLARMLSKQGAKVTAIEPAEGLINHAIEREKKENLGITYVKADLSKWEAVPNDFDIVVSNMVFMDIPDYQSAMRNCITALKSKGLFIFSISHPCFDIKGRWEEEKPYVQVTDYFSEYNIQNYIGYSFHHMLSTYVNFLIEQGCSVAKMLEPQLPLEIAKNNKRFERDKNIPNFLLIKAIKE